MNKLAMIAALPLALTLAACGGTDETTTTTMETDTMAPMDAGTGEPMVGTDTMAQEPMTDDMMNDPMMDDPTMTDPAATPQP